MQEIGVIALLFRRNAVVLEALPGVMRGIEAGTPALIAEGRIGDNVVKGLKRVAIEKERMGQRVFLLDLRRRVVVQDHVHASKSGGRVVLLLSKEAHLHIFASVTGLITDLKK